MNPGGSQGRSRVVIGLTGPIGCGKSTVAGWLAERGVRVVDADVLARDVTAPGAPTLPAIRRRFGDGVFAPDGSLDRGALAEVVFADPAALADLESIVHPAVHREILRELEAGGTGTRQPIVIEAIKLVEAGLAPLCDEVWIVECRPETRRARLRRRGSSETDAERRIAAQGPELVARLTAQLAAQGSPVPVRRLITDGTEAEVQRAVEAALAEALAGRR
jgi:dephospho-CoA kinase